MCQGGAQSFALIIFVIVGHYDSYFTDEKTEAQGGEATCPPAPHK